MAGFPVESGRVRRHTQLRDASRNNPQPYRSLSETSLSCAPVTSDGAALMRSEPLAVLVQQWMFSQVLRIKKYPSAPN